MKVQKLISLAASLMVAFGVSVAAPAAAHASSERWGDTDWGWIAYENKATGRCVDDSFEFGLRAIPCNGGVWQKWNVNLESPKHMWNKATNRCLDDSLAFGLRVLPCNKVEWQEWSYRGTTAPRNGSTHRCLDDSFAYGLRAFACNSGDWQAWNGW
ncbi:ricin-type beta-trefoil lectin domain protein [Kitasatospora sp. NBC_01560]|uniref:RICIN domain-containing protein n=1 Tax=Kitasatospora sp. NBC_01560 TaxID=2975965 RepID=UPI00386B00EC